MGKKLLDSDISGIPAPSRELQLDSPKSPFGRDIATCALDCLQTLIQCQSRKPPFLLSACGLESLDVVLQRLYFFSELQGVDVLRLQSENASDGGEGRSG